MRGVESLTSTKYKTNNLNFINKYKPYFISQFQN